MRLGPHIKDYKNMLFEHGFDHTAVTTGREAWKIAHHVGITNHAYNLSRDITDAHIQTALESLFPNAVFRDKKRY